MEKKYATWVFAKVYCTEESDHAIPTIESDMNVRCLNNSLRT